MRLKIAVVVALLATPAWAQVELLGPITSGIGQRETLGGGQGFHRGIDISVPVGTPVPSVASGTVVEHWVPPDGGPRWKGHVVYGGYLIIYHGRGVYSAYAHLSETFVHEGQYVFKDEIIALSGDTGMSTGPHLHLEMIVDPQWYAAHTITEIARRLYEVTEQ